MGDCFYYFAMINVGVVIAESIRCGDDSLLDGGMENIG